MNMKNYFHSLRGYTLVGIIRFAVMKACGKAPIVRGSCHRCGNCCRNLSLDDGRGWIRNKLDFEKIVVKRPEYGCFTNIGADEQGILQFSCSHLTFDGTCGNYKNRFSFCRDFPDKNLIFCGGGLPAGCGYKICSETPFSRVLETSFKKINEKNTDS